MPGRVGVATMRRSPAKATGGTGGPPSGDTCGDKRGLALRGERGPTGRDFEFTPLGFPARGNTVTRGCAALHPGLT